MVKSRLNIRSEFWGRYARETDQPWPSRPSGGRPPGRGSPFDGAWLTECISNSEGDDARVRWQDAVPTSRYPRSLAYVAAAAVCTSSTVLRNAPVQADEHPSLGRLARGSKRNGISSRPATVLAPVGQDAAGPQGPGAPRGGGPGRPDAGGRRAARGLRRHGRPLRRDRGGGARHRAGGELRHRRAGRGVQRHRHQRHREQLPLRRGRPRDDRGHGGHHRGRRRVRHGLDDARAVVQLHRQRRHRGHLQRRLPGVLAVRDHRRAAHRQLLGHQPERLGRGTEHRRVRDLDHGRPPASPCRPASRR